MMIGNCFWLQTLINLEDPIMLMRTVNYTFAVILNLFINSIPGQQVIDRSLKIHTHACVSTNR